MWSKARDNGNGGVGQEDCSGCDDGAWEEAAAAQGDKSETTATAAHGHQLPREEPRFAGPTLASGRFSTSPSFVALPSGGGIITAIPRSNGGINLSSSPSLTSSTMGQA